MKYTVKAHVDVINPQRSSIARRSVTSVIDTEASLDYLLSPEGLEWVSVNLALQMRHDGVTLLGFPDIIDVKPVGVK